MARPERWRIAVVLVCAVAAVASARDAAVFALGDSDPALALRLRGDDPVALGAAVRQRIAAPDAAAARRALRAEPLAPEPLWILATVSPGDQAGRLLRLGERVTPRSLDLQLMLIEEAVARGDVPGAVAHYDRALSIAPGSSQVLFPILRQAIASPAIATALVPYLRADRPWVRDFLTYAIAEPQRRDWVADLFARYGGARAVPAHGPLESALIVRLVESGFYDQAQAAAVRLAGPAALDQFGFTPATLDQRLVPLAWSLGNDGTRYEDGALIVTGGGTAATRVMVLRPGRWVVQSAIGRPGAQWTARCLSPASGAPFWQAPLADRVVLDVPADCRAVRFSLEVRGDDGSVLTLRHAALTPG
jgi:hypothetical protein